ncbi:hypothetical protein BDK51DRAFT_52648, partial [Blyttiomyces helicus]
MKPYFSLPAQLLALAVLAPPSLSSAPNPTTSTLVSDLLLLRHTQPTLRPPATTIAYDSSATSRLSREIKDRYDFLFSARARAHGATRARPRKIDVQHAALDAARRATFISTEADIDGLVVDFLDTAEALQSLRQSIPSVACEWDAERPATDIGLDAAITAEDLLPLFDIRRLPTRAQVERVFPFLSASAVPPTVDAVAHARSPFNRSTLISPDTWIYFLTNAGHYRCEVLTVEYVDALVEYVLERMRGWDRSSGDGVDVLEVGAGNGALAHWIREGVRQAGVNLRVDATDR